MKKIAKIFAIGICLLASSNIVYAQRWGKVTDMDRAEMKRQAEEANKNLTVVIAQDWNGNAATIDNVGPNLGVSSGFQGSNGAIKPFLTVIYRQEAIPTGKGSYRESENGRIGRKYWHWFSWEGFGKIGSQCFVPEALSQGNYLSYDIGSNLILRAPWLDEATLCRFSVGQLFGIGATYQRYDTTVYDAEGNEQILKANGFGVYLQTMTEIRWRPSKHYASSIFLRGGVKTLPGFKLNTVWTSFRGIGEFGVLIALAPNHQIRKVAPKDEPTLQLLPME